MPKKAEKSLSERALGFWGIAAIIWSLYKYYIQTDLFISEVFIKTTIFIGSAYLFIKYVENKDFFKTLRIFPDKRKTIIFSISTIILIYTLPVLIKVISVREAFMYLILNLATSIAEDTLMLGLALRSQISGKKQRRSSIINIALLYSLLRIPGLYSIPKIQGIVLIGILLSGFFLMTALSILYSRRMRLYETILLHFSYLTIISFLAF